MTGYILMIAGVVAVVVAVFVWSLCIAAARGDKRIDCFTLYREHLLNCDICDPPKTRCPVGVGIRQIAVEEFTEGRLKSHGKTVSERIDKAEDKSERGG